MSKVATIHIKGMQTMDSVSSITTDLGKAHGVESVKVFLNGKGVVHYNSNTSKGAHLAQMIQDSGFDSSLISDVDVSNKEDKVEITSMMIDGMTSEACAAKIESDIASMPGVIKATVTLGAGNKEIKPGLTIVTGTGIFHYDKDVTNFGYIAHRIERGLGFDIVLHFDHFFTLKDGHAQLGRTHNRKLHEL